MITPSFGGSVVLTSCPSMCPSQVSGRSKCDLGSRYNYIDANTRNDNGQAAELCRACFHTNPASWQSNSQSSWNSDRRTSDESITSNVWIGAYLPQGVSTSSTKSDWQFNDCTSMPTSSWSAIWASSNPNRAGGCLTISSSSGMNDRSCTSTYDVLCNSLAWERNNVPVHCRKEPTSQPTRVPSVVPSTSPSTSPTRSPSSSPTSTPTTSTPITSNPTTSNPTAVPTTTVPTTAFPTDHPTFRPTNRPTNRPTSTPTSDPTFRTTPLNTSTVAPPNSKLDESAIPVPQPRRGNEIIIGAGIGGVFGLCCVCVVMACFLHRKRKPNELNTELATRDKFLASESPKSNAKPYPSIVRVASEDPELRGLDSGALEHEPAKPASQFLGQLQNRVAIDDVLLDVIVEDMAAGNDDEDVLPGAPTTNGNAEGLAGPSQVENDFGVGGELELAPQNDGPVAFGIVPSSHVSTAVYGNEIGESDPPNSFQDVPMEEWTRQNVGEWFARVGRDSVWEEYGKMMQQQKIDGMTLKHLTEADMRNLGVRSFHVSALKSAIDEQRQSEQPN